MERNRIDRINRQMTNGKFCDILKTKGQFFNIQRSLRNERGKKRNERERGKVLRSETDKGHEQADHGKRKPNRWQAYEKLINLNLY